MRPRTRLVDVNAPATGVRSRMRVTLETPSHPPGGLGPYLTARRRRLRLTVVSSFIDAPCQRVPDGHERDPAAGRSGTGRRHEPGDVARGAEIARLRMPPLRA